MRWAILDPKAHLAPSLSQVSSEVEECSYYPLKYYSEHEDTVLALLSQKRGFPPWETFTIFSSRIQSWNLFKTLHPLWHPSSKCSTAWLYITLVWVWDLFMLIDVSELLYGRKQWIDPLLLLPCHFQFDRFYPVLPVAFFHTGPCQHIWLFPVQWSFCTFFYPGHSSPRLFYFYIREMGSEPDIRALALWIYALMQSCSLLSQWLLTFNLLFSSVNYSLSWGFTYLLYYLYYLSGWFVTYTMLSRSSSWCSELGDHNFKL